MMNIMNCDYDADENNHSCSQASRATSDTNTSSVAGFNIYPQFDLIIKRFQQYDH